MIQSNDVKCKIENKAISIGSSSNANTTLSFHRKTQDIISNMSDKEIVSAILKRNKDVTYLFLYKKCYPLFKAIFINYYTDCESCMEFINNIYLYIMTPSKSTGINKLQGFRYECALTLWIKQVCIYYCYARYKRKTKEETFLQTYADRLKEESHSINVDFSKIERDDILKLLSYMSNSRYAEIIRLFYVENKTNDEVAEILGMSKSNLYNKHILAKEMFAKILRKEVRYV